MSDRLNRLARRLERAARAAVRFAVAAERTGRETAFRTPSRALAAAQAARKAAWRAVLGWRRMSPPVVFVTSFVLLVLLGTAGFLGLPGLYRGDGLGLIDALFTATSAVCVTGLAVVDTATYFTFWGQLWILVLIQLGGIGLISLTTLIIGALGGRVSIRAELTGVPGGPRGEAASIWQLAAEVARFTLVVEAAGAALLFLWWLGRFPIDEALWHAVFHSISAFCNAGFSTFTTSLEAFAGDPVTLVIVSILIIAGGIGYVVLRESWSWWKRPHRGRRPRLSTHTFAVLVVTAGLLVFGTVCYAVFEWRGVLGEMGVVDRLSNAWFMSVTARTAGFNSVPYGELHNAGGFLTILLMFIGGSPGSTAGGLKTTTLAVLVGLGWSRIHARQRAAIHGRDVPAETLERTVSLTLLALAVLTVAFFLMTAITAAPASPAEARQAFLPMAFEVVSAFSTVGLSMGTTAELGPAGELLVIALMFIGRVGLFSFFSAVLLRRRRAPAIRLASEDLIVG